jgi:hypothetical protein
MERLQQIDRHLAAKKVFGFLEKRGKSDRQ